jgi:hypothetical protein
MQALIQTTTAAFSGSNGVRQSRQVLVGAAKAVQQVKAAGQQRRRPFLAALLSALAAFAA